MKTAILFLCIIFHFNTYGQKITGRYENYGGHDLIINSDSSYETLWRFDLMSFWSIGKWKFVNDTIYLIPTLIYDTLSNGKADSLILSNDTISNRLANEVKGCVVIQERYSEVIRLIQKNNYLYPINKKGRIVKKYSGEKRIIAFDKDRIDKKPIILFSWRNKYPAYYYRQTN